MRRQNEQKTDLKKSKICPREPKWTENWSSKVADLSHLVLIWSMMMLNLTPLILHWDADWLCYSAALHSCFSSLSSSFVTLILYENVGSCVSIRAFVARLYINIQLHSQWSTKGERTCDLCVYCSSTQDWGWDWRFLHETTHPTAGRHIRTVNILCTYCVHIVYILCTSTCRYGFIQRE